MNVELKPSCRPTPREPAHLDTQPSAHQRALRNSLYRALATAVVDGSPAETLRVLDVGCGRGELMELLADSGHAVTGIDPEPECVRLSSQFGPCVAATVATAPEVFPPAAFDVVISSHVLEHLSAPHAALTALRELDCPRYVFAVPNVLRPARIVRSLLGSARGDHAAHVFGWGRAELASLLRNAGFRSAAWYTDRVTVNPLGGRAGALATRLLEPLEAAILPRVFPLFSSSRIVACNPDKSN